MTHEALKSFFLWCLILNAAILLIWFILLTVARDMVYRVHSAWFKISRERLVEIHYAGMMYFKLAVFVLNLVPYLALLIIDS